MKHLINYRNILFVFFYFAMTIISCNDESDIVIEDIKSQDQESYILKDKAILNIIKNLGFEIEQVWVYEDYFIVENDIALPKEYVVSKSSNKNNGENKVTQTAVLSDLAMDYVNTNNVSYFIDQSVFAMNNGVEWANAIRVSTIDWSSIANSSVNFIEVFTANNAELIIYSDNSLNTPSSHRNLPSNVWARATFPENGNIGSVISINDIPPSPPNQNGRISIITHELGHCLGFHHSTVGNSSISQVLCNTIINDPTSIMQPSFSGLFSVPINQDDIRALRYLYPDYGSLFPVLNISVGSQDRRTGTRSITISMINDNGMDWGTIVMNNTSTACAPVEGGTVIFRSIVGVGSIKFLNYKRDHQSNTVYY